MFYCNEDDLCRKYVCCLHESVCTETLCIALILHQLSQSISIADVYESITCFMVSDYASMPTKYYIFPS